MSTQRPIHTRYIRGGGSYPQLGGGESAHNLNIGGGGGKHTLATPTFSLGAPVFLRHCTYIDTYIIHTYTHTAYVSRNSISAPSVGNRRSYSVLRFLMYVASLLCAFSSFLVGITGNIGWRVPPPTPSPQSELLFRII